MVGLTSISFRNLNVDEIISMCYKAEVDVIEWGSDIHVPIGDIALAKDVGNKTRAKGIKTMSYGTYYRLGHEENPEEEFMKVVGTAKALGVSIIRIWGGRVSEETDLSKMIASNIEELKRLTKIAAKEEMIIGLEYHRNTVTETKEVTKQIIDSVGASNLKTYWQMNPDISNEERLKEIELLKNDICNVHVFYWEKDAAGNDQRHTIEEGATYWHGYWQLLKFCECPGIIEFVKGDTIKQFYEDIKALKKIVR